MTSTVLASARRTNLLLLLPALLIAGLVYGKTPGISYCGSDDSRETRRAALEDSSDWTKTFRTRHFGGAKYRPLGRLIQLWSYELRPQDPLFLRVRNVGAHL